MKTKDKIVERHVLDEAVRIVEWKMAVDDRVRSLLKIESGQNGKGKGKAKGKTKRLTLRSCTALTKTTTDLSLKIRLNK